MLRLRASQDVQYFQFDEFGNMFVFQPGSGFSGPSVKVQPGFEMHEIYESTQHLAVQSDDIKEEKVTMSPQASLSHTDSIEPTPIKRLILVYFSYF